jgi:hypothetical protein
LKLNCEEDPENPFAKSSLNDDTSKKTLFPNPFKKGCRNKMEDNIIYSIEKQCRCNKHCLESIKESKYHIMIFIIYTNNLIDLKVSSPMKDPQRY